VALKNIVATIKRTVVYIVTKNIDVCMSFVKLLYSVNIASFRVFYLTNVTILHLKRL